jgi:enoyl-CoA hydratase/carnithine racemase
MTRKSSLDESILLRENHEGVATLTLNTPSNFNALSSAMIASLQSAFDQLAGDREVRVIVLASTGRAFCAGHDLREMRSLCGEAAHRALFERCSKLMMTVADLPQPVIAKVRGLATAAGCQLVASCDLALASFDASFATSGIRLGLFCSTPAVALARNLNAKRTAEMLFTGEFIDAQQAAVIGLINRAVPDDALDAETSALARRIALHSGAALMSGKRLLRALRGQSSPAGADALAHAYSLASANMARDMQTRDAIAGIDAFLEKTPSPNWLHQ